MPKTDVSQKSFPATTLPFTLILIGVVGLLAYGNSFFFDSFNFDDTTNILGANARRNLGTLSDLLDPRGQRSIGYITFALNHRLFGPSPQAFHVTNTLIHLLSACSLSLLVATILSTPRFSPAPESPAVRFAPLAAGLLFVSHPIQTQAVTYIVQRFTSLATLLYLLALLFYLRARLARLGGDGRRARRNLAVMFVAMLCALQSKEIAATIPLTVILCEFVFFDRDRVWRAALLSLIILPAVIVPVTLFGPAILSDPAALLERLRVQTSMGRDVYFYTQLPVLLAYLRLIFFPVGQSVEHLPPVHHSLLEPPVMAAALIHLLLVGGAVWAIRSGRDGKGPKLLAGFGILWFYVTSLVESSVIPFIDLMFEHRVYLPFAGICMSVAGGVMMLEGKRPLRWATGAGGLLVILLVILTALRNQVWRNPVTLWSDAVEKAPASSRAWNNLAYAHLKDKRPEAAIPALLRSIELDPGKTDVWNNLAIALDQLGIYRGRYHRVYNRFTSAEDYHTSQTVWFANAWNNLGLLRFHVGQYAAAIQAFQKALAVYPELAVARFNLGVAAVSLGSPELALPEYERLRAVAPEMAATLRGLIERSKR